MHSRRAFLGRGLAAAALGLSAQRTFGWRLLGAGEGCQGGLPLRGAGPINDIGNGGPSVLTLYWLLCWGTGRFTLVPGAKPFETYSAAIVPQVDRILGLFGLARKDVEQVRLTRWGHAMPVCAPRLIVDGVVEKLRRPLDGTIYFVQQDNWALPAVENSVLDARQYAEEIRAGL